MYETEVRAIDMMLDHMTDSKQAATEEKRREHLQKQLTELIDCLEYYGKKVWEILLQKRLS
jgi:hypothetical protein